VKEGGKTVNRAFLHEKGKRTSSLKRGKEQEGGYFEGKPWGGN